ncbi:MAG: nucleotide exchange factor GrpE [Candidatus Lokiarchaeota archaeon]|nr:nucleotide exchange factor GrpE [Candidatus Lokiarchaeota archaeon]MBD3199181.1 nucleotide exchange factor GrpE [Candidatus Lokiarchaeota archaeon]
MVDKNSKKEAMKNSIEESTEENKKDSEKDKEVKNEVDDDEKEKLLLEHFSKEDLQHKIKELEKGVKETKNKIKELESKNVEWKDKFMRLQAEFENTQKRWERSRQNLKIQYTGNVLKGFLPLYDSFKSALKNDQDEGSIRGFYNQFIGILRSYGAEPMNLTEGEEYDYNKHEALSSIEKEDLPDKTIIDVIQDGWKLGKEVLRYAKVIISRKPQPKKKEPKKEETHEDKEVEKENESNEDLKEQKENMDTSDKEK